MVLYINIGGDIGDIAPIYNAKTWRSSERSHCSGLVRLLPDGSDIYISQVCSLPGTSSFSPPQATWTALNGMLRTFKLYDFPFRLDGSSEERVPAIRSSFSSYPGSIFSGDDFYVLSSGMVVQETTIGFDNPELNKFIQPTAVLEWLRNVIANRLASSGAEWTGIYSQFNSGTYNNQNMVWAEGCSSNLMLFRSWTTSSSLLENHS
jgi:hypothetical protein